VQVRTAGRSVSARVPRSFRARNPLTVKQAADAWIASAKAGAIRNRSGAIYKPSAIRSYDDALNARVLPALGGYRLADLRRQDVQRFAERLLGEGLDPSTIKNALMPLRAIYRRHVALGDVAVSPTDGLHLPAAEGRRDRIVSPTEAAKLIAALRPDDRALWSTAFYAGLRLGELQALRWSDVDLAAGVIRVERGWDREEGEIAPKSAQGRRRVPIAAALRDALVEHRMQSQRDGLVFGSTADRAFTPSAVRRRARREAAAAPELDAELMSADA
jgi:integrase